MVCKLKAFGRVGVNYVEVRGSCRERNEWWQRCNGGVVLLCMSEWGIVGLIVSSSVGNPVADVRLGVQLGVRNSLSWCCCSWLLLHANH